jgi:hypothetical protein
MGSCYSINIFLQNENRFIQDNTCIICWENVCIEKKYVKCTKCNIIFHHDCALRYKDNKDTSIIYCPHCKRIKTLFIYDNEIYDCKKW